MRSRHLCSAQSSLRHHTGRYTRNNSQSSPRLVVQHSTVVCAIWPFLSLRDCCVHIKLWIGICVSVCRELTDKLTKLAVGCKCVEVNDSSSDWLSQVVQRLAHPDQIQGDPGLIRVWRFFSLITSTPIPVVTSSKAEACPGIYNTALVPRSRFLFCLG